MTSYNEYITDLEEQHGLIPKNVLVRTYNYRDPQSAANGWQILPKQRR
ncbi:hypothetical protein [Enterobacter hormaechei]|nr:hypothetical protein [Enterobacter hormaechei]